MDKALLLQTEVAHTHAMQAHASTCHEGTSLPHSKALQCLGFACLNQDPPDAKGTTRFTPLQPPVHRNLSLPFSLLFSLSLGPRHALCPSPSRACSRATTCCFSRCASAWTCTCGWPSPRKGPLSSSMWPTVSAGEGQQGGGEHESVGTWVPRAAATATAGYEH